MARVVDPGVAEAREELDENLLHGDAAVILQMMQDALPELFGEKLDGGRSMCYP